MSRGFGDGPMHGGEPYNPQEVLTAGEGIAVPTSTVEVITESFCLLKEVEDVLIAADEDHGPPDITPAEVVERIIKERDELKKMITQLQERNRDLVDERRAADIHYRDVKVVYVAHPLSGPDRDANIARASRWCAWAFKSGYAPVADWIVLASQLDESWREKGLKVDCALIRRCDEIWLCGGRVSEGMRIEAAAARLVGIPVKDMTDLGEEPPKQYAGVDVKKMLDLVRRP